VSTLLSLLFISLTSAAQAQDLPMHTRPPIRILADAQDPGRLPPGVVLESRVVTIDHELLRASLEHPGQLLPFPLPSGEQVMIVSHGVRPGYGEDSWTATGTLEQDSQAQFTLAGRNGFVAARLTRGGRETYTISPISGGSHALRRVLPDRGIDCGVSYQRGAPPPPPGGAAQEEGGYQATSTLDLLVIYTNLAAQAFSDYAGGGIDGHKLAWLDAELGVALTNVAFASSGIDATVRLCGIINIEYLESGESIDPDDYVDEPKPEAALNAAYDTAFNADLDALADPDTILGSQAALWRDVTGADMVTMVIKNEGHAGLAKSLDTFPSPATDHKAFMVVRFYWVSGLTLAHEIGHCLGCAHDNIQEADKPWQGTYIYSRGHHFQVPSGPLCRTVMAYLHPDVDSSSQQQVSYFSNPAVSYLGIPTGVSDSSTSQLPADNAQTINDTIPTISAYRPVANPQPDVWVDPVAAITGLEFGLPQFPFRNLDTGILSVLEGGRIHIAAGSTFDTPGMGFQFPIPKHVVFDVEGTGSVLLTEVP
jgi:hypothetical protein